MNISGPKKPRVVQPQWLNKADKVKTSKAHELRLAKELGGQRTPRSGGLPFSPFSNRTQGRDIETKDSLIEHKNTTKNSISIKKEWLEGIKLSASAAFKDPMVIITFQNGHEKPEDWVMIPIEVYKRLQAGQETLDTH